MMRKIFVNKYLVYLNDKGFETKSMLSSEDGINSFKKKNYSLVF